MAQSLTVGGVLFLVLLARPLAGRLGKSGLYLAKRVARLAAWSAIGLCAAEALFVSMQVAVISATLDLGVLGILDANFAVVGLAKCTAALLIAALLLARGPAASRPAVLALAALVLLAAAFTTHSAARVEGRSPLMALEVVHLFGAALWIGGIPAFLLLLGRHGASSAPGSRGSPCSASHAFWSAGLP